MKLKKKLQVDKSILKDFQLVLVRLTALQKRILGETGLENDSLFSVLVSDVYKLSNKINGVKIK